MRRPRFLSPQERVNSPQRHFILQKQQIGHYVYDPTRTIGRGQFSVVYPGHQILMPNNQVAVKIITIQPDKPLQKYMIENEISILNSVDSPYILKLLHHQTMNQQVFLVSQLCRKGDLLQNIQRSLITEDQAMIYTLQIAKALKALHDKNIMHGDIKSANILLGDHCVVGDFGFAQHLEQAQTAFIIGTPLYMAPELLFDNKCSLSADIWSLGCVLYEMVYGCSPFYSEHEEILRKSLQTYLETGQLQFPNTGVSRKLKILIQALMKTNPDDRLTADIIINLLEPGRITQPQVQNNSGADTTKKVDEKQNGRTNHQQQLFTQTSSNKKVQNTSVNRISTNISPFMNVQKQPVNIPKASFIINNNTNNDNDNNNNINLNPNPITNPNLNQNQNQNSNLNLNLNQNKATLAIDNIQQQIEQTIQQQQQQQQLPQQQQQQLQQQQQQKSKVIELIDLVKFFYNIYQQVKNINEKKLAFLYLKLVNIYYLAYVEEQSKMQKKLFFLQCQNEYFELEKEIKVKQSYLLKDEEFQRIFYSKFSMTFEFIRYTLEHFKQQLNEFKGTEYEDRIKKSIQIINMLLTNETNNSITLDAQVVKLHNLN